MRARPARATAHSYLGEVMLRQGRVADGVREFQIAADLQPGNPDALRLLGIAQGQSGQLEAAVAEAAENNMPTVGAVRQIVDRRRAALGKPPAVVTRFSTNPRAVDVVVRTHRLETYDQLTTENRDETD